MSSTGGRGRHERAPRPQGFWAEYRDAVSPRTVGLVVGVLLLQLGFILSYAGAFHAPTPHRIPLAVVAPAQVSATTVGQLDAIAGSPVQAVAVANRAVAERRLRDGDTAAVFVVDPTGTTDTLLTAGAAGASLQTAVTAVLTGVDTAQHRTVTARDVVPLQAGDGRGLTGFYLVIGWIVGGYLVASLLGVATGARPATLRRASFRLGAVVPYAVVSGLGGALIVDQWLGALTGHFVALWWLGALLVASAATVTMAFQVLLGTLGIGITVLVFVVLGNPSAGGAYQRELLPPFWRALTDVLPNGAGTDTVRRIVYFGANGVTGHLLVIAAWVVVGTAVTLVGSHLLRRRDPAAPAPVGPGPADA